MFQRLDFAPAQQGQLDGFCGIYVGINSFCRRLGAAPSHKPGAAIFRRLLTLLDEQNQLTVSRICTGFREGQLQKAFNKLAVEKRLDLRTWALNSFVSREGIGDPFDLIKSLADDEAAMPRMDAHKHWILAHFGTEKQFWVDDSSEEPAPVRIRAGEVSKYRIKLSDGLAA